MKKYVIPVILAVAIIASGCAEKQVYAPSVIPQPVQMTTEKGVFTLTPSSIIKYNGGEYAEGVANYLAELALNGQCPV